VVEFDIHQDYELDEKNVGHFCQWMLRTYYRSGVQVILDRISYSNLHAHASLSVYVD
jgi:hypothetical protein